MPRPAPWRLVRANYPEFETVQTRFQDLDTMGHLNNVAFAALFETARVKFNYRLGRALRGDDRMRAVVARNEINYLAEGSYPEDVEIALGVGAIGRRSWDLLAVMFQSGRAIATCDTTIVMNAASGDALPDAFREKIEALRVREL